MWLGRAPMAAPYFGSGGSCKRVHKTMSQQATLIEKAADFARRGRLQVLCGAGVSHHSGLPLALPLKQQIYQVIGAASADIALLMKSGQPLELVLETASDFCGFTGIAGIIEMFRAAELQPTRIHKAIASLCQAGFVRCVFTTNFDVLIEQALAALEVTHTVYSTESQFNDVPVDGRDQGSIGVIKLHGCATGRIADMGATLRRVAAGELSGTKSAVLEKLLSSAVPSVVLVLGYSCSDVFDLVPIVRGLNTKSAKVVFVEHFLGGDTHINDKKQRFDRMFGGFDADWLRVDTDIFLTDLLQALGIVAPELECLTFDWRRHIQLWQTKAHPAECALILGAVMSYIGAHREALRHNQTALALVERELQRPTHDLFSETWRAVTSPDTLIHKLKEGQLITSSELLGPRTRHARCLGAIGVAYKELSDYGAAERYLTEALKVGRGLGDEGPWLDSLGSVWARIGDHARAREYYERAVAEARSREESNALALRLSNLGNACSDLGDGEQARRFYLEAMGLAERIGHIKAKSIALVNLSVIEFRAGRYDEAGTYNDRALTLAEELGDEASKGGCIERRQALRDRHDPGEITDIQCRVIATFSSGSPGAALELLRRAMSEHPGNAALHALCGSILGQLGDKARALEQLNTALLFNSNEPRYHIARGIILDHMGRSDEALADFDEALRLDATSSRAYYERGVAYRCRNELDRALQDFENSMALDDRNHEAYLAGAQVLDRLGRSEEALEYAWAAVERGSASANRLVSEIEDRQRRREGEEGPTRQK
jgi:tetratricopeptide (TPR) repeat protein